MLFTELAFSVQHICQQEDQTHTMQSTIIKDHPWDSLGHCVNEPHKETGKKRGQITSEQEAKLSEYSVCTWAIYHVKICIWICKTI